LTKQLGRPATLDDIPDHELDRFAVMGFHSVWSLSVWQTGPAGKRVSRTNAEWRKEFQETLMQQLLAGFKAVAPRYSDFWGLGCDCSAF
jgi:hypothetical protein